MSNIKDLYQEHAELTNLAMERELSGTEEARLDYLDDVLDRYENSLDSSGRKSLLDQLSSLWPGKGD